MYNRHIQWSGTQQNLKVGYLQCKFCLLWHSSCIHLWWYLYDWVNGRYRPSCIQFVKLKFENVNRNDKKNTSKLLFINILLPLFFFNSMYDWTFNPIASLFSSVKWIFLLSILLQVHSPFQSKLSTEYDLMLALSISSIPSFIYVHPVAAYICFLVFMSLFSLCCIFPSKMCIRRQFLRQMWPIPLVFFPFIVCMIFLSILTLCNTAFLTCLVQLISILLQHHISKLSRYFCSTVPSVWISAPYKYFTLTKCKRLCKCRETHFKLHSITVQAWQFCIVALHTFCALFVSMFLTKLKSGCSASTKNSGVQKDSIIIVSVILWLSNSTFCLSAQNLTIFPYTQCFVAFPLQQWLSECATLLQYMYTAYLAWNSEKFSFF